ncbi:MAG: type II secretion system inner membrane protein GspF [Candidatus Polarisedimenticolaceae bacterium]|nr:type II secretion system inner membrane protein GspF [Candidatus Polarisedimenticolaceae bacterium]
MEAYKFVALDPAGKEKRGTLEGDSAKQVRQQLRDSNLIPLSVDVAAKKESANTPGGFTLQRRISAMDLALITRQLSTLLRSGLPLEITLKSVAKQTKKRHIEQVLLAVRARVREGHSLSSGLAEFPSVFPELYHRTISAGEESGHLDSVLDRLADYTEKRQQMQQKTVLALFYPALLTLLSIAIVVGLITFIVPKIVKVFETMDQELPIITQALITTSATLREHGLAMLGVLVLLVIVTRMLLQRPAIRMVWHRIILHIPIIGNLVRSINAARFSRTLSILAASSTPILDALHISSQVIASDPIRAAVEQAASRVREGSSLQAALEQTGYFPPLTISLLASGEASGNLEGMLEHSADIQEREIEALITTILGMFEPLLILVMGGVVLTIVLAILLPIFELNQLVS